jgi:lysozyme
MAARDDDVALAVAGFGLLVVGYFWFKNSQVSSSTQVAPPDAGGAAPSVSYDTSSTTSSMTPGTASTSQNYAPGVYSNYGPAPAAPVTEFAPVTPNPNPVQKLANAIFPMHTSPRMIAFIKKSEGLTLTAEPDEGNYAVGWGHEVSSPMTITLQQAVNFFASDLSNAENEVHKYVHVPLTQGQFDALVDFAFNVTNFAGSSVVSLVNQGNYAGASAAFGNYIRGHQSRKVYPGLVKRRAGDQAFFNS